MARLGRYIVSLVIKILNVEKILCLKWEEVGNEMQFDSRKGIHLKNFWSFVIMLICRDYIFALFIHFALRMVSWLDTETSAFILDKIPEKAGCDDWNNKNVNTPYEHFLQIPVNMKVYIKNLQIQICKSNKKKDFNWSQEMHRLIQTKNHWRVS